jgi:hypothetical protein
MNFDKTQSDQTGIGQTCMDTGLIRCALIQLAAFHREMPNLDIGRKSHPRQTKDSPDSPPFGRKYRAGPMSPTIQIKSQAQTRNESFARHREKSIPELPHPGWVADDLARC